MSSSIFSSETVRRYGALPRKERFWHAAIAVAAAIAVLVCREIPPRLYGTSGCRGGSLGSTAVASLSDRTEVLFAGSSHVLFGVRPQRFTVHAMNLAGTWLDYTCIRAIVARHLHRVPNLKVAVIEYDELPYVSDLVPAIVATRDVRPLQELGLSPAEFPTAGATQAGEVFATSFMFPFTSLPRVTPLAWRNRDKSCSPLYHPPRGFAPGYYYTDGVTPKNFNAGAVFNALAKASEKVNVVRRNAAALTATIALLRSRGTAVVLLRLPHARDYVTQRPPIVSARFRELQRIAIAASRSDAGIAVWDLGEDPAFAPADFCDNNHLNAAGADKLAKLLDAPLRALASKTVAEVR
jgi:hypothetical protein